MVRGMHKLVVAGVLCVLASCSRDISLPNDHLPVPANYQGLRASEVGARTDAAAAGAAATVPLAVASFANAGVTLAVVPGAIPGCDPRAQIVSTVSWQVADPMLAVVKLEISEASNPAHKLFAQGGRKGEAKTGNWVSSGMQFHLLDAATGKELATHVVTHAPCR